MASIAFGQRNLRVFPLRRHIWDAVFQHGPYNCTIQRRWKKPVDSARTRQEGRTRDHKLDKLMIQLKNLRLALDLHELISQQRNGFASLQLLSRWRHEVGLNIEIGAFLKKYPHIFYIYVHPVKRNECCKVTPKMAELIAEEDAVIRENEPAIVKRLKKLLMLMKDGTLNMHALWLIRRELGLPDDYRCSILTNHQSDFSLGSPDTLTLVTRDETGFKIENGFREKLGNWQRLPYTKAYDKNDLHPIHNVGRLEKRIVGILHELLSLTVEKMIPLERLSHFRRPFGMEVNLRELILKHLGIFYISTKGSTQHVLLRESYSKGCLVDPNPVYNVFQREGALHHRLRAVLSLNYEQAAVEYSKEVRKRWDIIWKRQQMPTERELYVNNGILMSNSHDCFRFVEVDYEFGLPKTCITLTKLDCSFQANIIYSRCILGMFVLAIYSSSDHLSKTATMDAPFLSTSLAVLATLFLLALPLSAATHDILPLKSSLFVEEYETNILQSSDGTFSCGFYNITNAYNITSAFTFSIWYSNSADKAIVWSANRGRPVHSRRSEITLRKDGNIVLTDYDGTVVWQTDGKFPNVRYVQLLNTGNLVLKNSSGNIVWQSFDSPTDTLLPTQRILATTKLVSTTGLQVPSHYTFRFSDQSILSLIYDDTNVSGVYWPDPDYQYYENNRNLYNSTRIGSLDDYGEFFSSDLAKHQARVASDRSLGIKRRLTLDYDGNLRLYSLNNSDGTWTISWIAQPQTCMTHGLCGPYGICHYSPTPRCSCPPGYKMRNPGNWTQGCKPIVEIACDGKQNVTFLQLRNTDFWGSDQQRIEKVPWEVCWNTCISDCTCKGFQYQEGNGTCYPKSFLFNGRTFPTPFVRTMYIKLPSSLDVSKKPIPQSSIHDYTLSGLDCDHLNTITTEAVRNMNKIGGEEPKWFYFYGFIGVFFIVEVFFFAFAWFFVLRKEMRSSQVWIAEEGYRVMTSHFRMYSHRELVKATERFKHELGWGGSGVVYKGILDDDRAVVIKKLENVTQNREEFQDELHVISRINHMNLVRIYGFCSERFHRLLVLEYVENGSLANVLFNSKILLDWKQRFNIALGVAKGLAYLHHECLEWVIHCNLKPENILLDENLEPKITDFGLAKLLSRSGSNQNVSRARGTIGYIAPEWISGLPITAKVDVYSYGVVLLELVSGRRVFDLIVGEDKTKVHEMLKKFIKMICYRLDNEKSLWLAEFVDFRVGDEFNYLQAKTLVKLAVSCLEEDRKKRPTMESIVESLLSVDLARS
uniref:non-specific serine/threonine protein kinase n=5 Tax=Oryza sativa TaxID=4530 RepID=Q2RAY8_ORYSJ|nr:D-mannose binding lectin family protein, expressed [Oryza sativa Japonica Group]